MQRHVYLQLYINFNSAMVKFNILTIILLSTLIYITAANFTCVTIPPIPGCTSYLIDLRPQLNEPC